ncbi:hypothetical protein GGI64_004147 [Rhizobium leguminosarum]|uniref:Uncharacterized protein n=1 Tax=Rhizobium leguminosarum TaxID=384 RepID=A0A7Z0E1H2_RHILE|nr:hypothetical protein [Rhizobium leguminosarum]
MHDRVKTVNENVSQYWQDGITQGSDDLSLSPGTKRRRSPAVGVNVRKKLRDIY